ncbi:MAG: septum site-determining protein MinC [Firmicutes bacterium]|nr:septum site-determining protein MinC [Bacillota bacterium]
MGGAISIKGTRRGLVILVGPGLRPEEIKGHLLARMEAARGFFKGAVFSFAPDSRLGPEQLRELQAICRRYGMIPAAPEAQPRRSPVRSRNELPPGAEPALLVASSLRGGQYVAYRGHVVVLGGTHPGAVVRAGGDVIVAGTCRGTVEAGLAPDPGARVVAARLAPERLTIAGVPWQGATDVAGHASYDVAQLSEGRVVLRPAGSRP